MGARKGPKGKGKGGAGPRGQTGQGTGAAGGGRGEGRERRAGRPRSRTYSQCGAFPPASNKCLRTTPITTTGTTATSVTSTPTLETSSPPNRPYPSTSQPPPRRGRSRRGWPLPRRRGGRARGGPRRHRGCRGSRRGGQRGPGPGTGIGTRSQTPLGGEALPLVVEVYGWLSWACSGTTRGMSNRLFNAVPLWRDGGDPEVLPGGVGGPRRPREGPPGGDLGGVDRQGANVAGFPGGGGGAPHDGCECQQLAPLGLAQRPHPLALAPAEPAADAAAPAFTQVTTQVTAAPRQPRR